MMDGIICKDNFGNVITFPINGLPRKGWHREVIITDKNLFQSRIRVSQAIQVHDARGEDEIAYWNPASIEIEARWIGIDELEAFQDALEVAKVLMRYMNKERVVEGWQGYLIEKGLSSHEKA